MPGQRKYTIVAILTLAISILALYVHRHREGQTGRIDGLINSVTGGFQRNFSYFFRGTNTIFDHYLWLVNAKRDNEKLRKDLSYLEMKLAALTEVENENARLREALQFRAKTDPRPLIAHVVAHDVSPDYMGIRIDRGVNDNIQPGMGVISSAGLVGRIQRVTSSYSDVITLVDPGSNIDGVIQRSRARGIISGQANRLGCRLKYLDRLEDVAVNDTVVSSGFGSIFPKGLVIGYVDSVQQNPNGILQSVTVRSAVDIYRLEEVFIVLPPAETSETSR